MQKFLWAAIFLVFGLGILLIVFFALKNNEDFAYELNDFDTKDILERREQEKATSTIETIKQILPKKDPVMLSVPYVSEAPEGNWTGNWVNACEEATIAMVDAFYAGKTSVGVLEAKRFLQNLFDIQDRIYGNNKNADASQIYHLITEHTTFRAEIKENPTLDELKNEIEEGRPVISLHRGFDLKNPNIPFSPTKSSYHTVVIVGFDDIREEFITHDPGDDKEGAHHRYKYNLFMDSIHNYNAETDKTDGTPAVIFTSSK